MKSFAAVAYGAVLFVLVANGVSAAAPDDLLRKLEAEANKSVALIQSDAPHPPAAASFDSDVKREADKLTHEFKMHQEQNKVYQVLILSLLAIGSLFVVLRFLSANTKDPAQHMVGASGLVCIVYGTIMLSIMAQTDQQLTATVGILGAVAGYLFRAIRPNEPEGQKPGAPTHPKAEPPGKPA